MVIGRPHPLVLNRHEHRVRDFVVSNQLIGPLSIKLSHDNLSGADPHRRPPRCNRRIGIERRTGQYRCAFKIHRLCPRNQQMTRQMTVDNALGHSRCTRAIQNVVLLIERHLNIWRRGWKLPGPRRVIAEHIAGTLQGKSKLRANTGQVQKLIKRGPSVIIRDEKAFHCTVCQHIALRFRCRRTGYGYHTGTRA